MSNWMRSCWSLAMVLTMGACGDEPTDVCPHGKMVEGHGCFLPCEDGWREAENGSCRLDCPPFSAPGPDGLCSLPDCPEGWVAGGKDEPLCRPGCPAGFIADSHEGGSGCRLPCPEGFSPDDEGWCRLDCPETMVPADDLLRCGLAQVGSVSSCPAGPWAEAAESAGVLRVLAGAVEELPDGSEAKPFPSIQAAVAHAQAEQMSAVTILIGPGVYQEAVLIDGIESVSLLGLCSDQTLVVAQETGILEPGEEYPWVSRKKALGGISILGARLVEVRGMMIQSDGAGLLVASHDLPTGPSSVAISELVVEESAASGIELRGDFGQIDVADCTVTEAVGSGIKVLAEPSEGKAGQAVITVRRNHISKMTHCRGSLCGEADLSVGIGATGGAELLVEQNLVEQFDQAVGIFVDAATRGTVRHNLISELTGLWGIVAFLPESEVVGNRIANGKQGEIPGLAPLMFSAISVGPPSGGSGRSTVTRNLVHKNNGAAVEAFADDSSASEESLDLIVKENEFNEVVVGTFVRVKKGALEVVENRVSKSQNVLLAFGTAPSFVAANEVRDGTAVEGFRGTQKQEDLIANTMAVFGVLTPGDAFHGEATFSGNRVLTQGYLGDGDQWDSLFWAGMQEVATVAGNVFEGNSTTLLVDLAVSVDAVVEDNLMVGPDKEPTTGTTGRGALNLIVAGKGGRMSVQRNLIRDFAQGYGPSLSFTSTLLAVAPGVTTEIAENVFWNTCSSIFQGAANSPAEQVMFTRNQVLYSHLALQPILDLAVTDNHLSHLSLLSFANQPAAGTAAFSGNLFDRSMAVLMEPRGSITVNGNEFSRALGAGLVVASADGQVAVTHNLFNRTDKAPAPWGNAGAIGDAIQVTGSSDNPCRGVEVTGNLFAYCYRSGLVVSTSAAKVEGNSFDPSCPFYIQTPPDGNSVTGADKEFALSPPSPLGVILATEMK